MTFEEWYEENKHFLYDDPVYFAQQAWNAAKEDIKPITRIMQEDVDHFYIDASDASDCVEKYFTLWEYPRFYTKDAAEKWAIENGYRIEES